VQAGVTGIVIVLAFLSVLQRPATRSWFARASA